MTMLSGAQMLVRSLEDLGVDTLFGYPGGAVLDIYDALLESEKIHHVLARHEQGVAHMADGYAEIHRQGRLCPGDLRSWCHQYSNSHCHSLYGFNSSGCHHRSGGGTAYWL